MDTHLKMLATPNDLLDVLAHDIRRLLDLILDALQLFHGRRNFSRAATKAARRVSSAHRRCRVGRQGGARR